MVLQKACDRDWRSSVGSALVLKCRPIANEPFFLFRSQRGLSLVASPRLPFVTFSINGQNFEAQ